MSTHDPQHGVGDDVGRAAAPVASQDAAGAPDVPVPVDDRADASDEQDEQDAHAVEDSLGGVLGRGVLGGGSTDAEGEGAPAAVESAKPALAEAEPEATAAAAPDDEGDAGARAGADASTTAPDPDPSDKSADASADAHAPAPAPTDTPDTPDDRQCRICLGGPEDEDDLGRLISPCLCTGSMRHVHVKCINQWRGTGPNAKNFLQCPQCGHQYRIQRTLIFGLATSKKILALVTLVLFTALTLAAGQILLRLLLASLAEAKAEKKAAAEAAARGEPAPEREWDSDAGGTAIYVFGAGLMYDVIMEAVLTFLDILWKHKTWDHDGWLANLVLWFLLRFTLGIAALGSLSFLSLLISLSLFAPLQLVHTFRGTGIFDGLRNRLRGRGYLLVVAMVAIGVFNSIVQVYDVVQAVSMSGLQYVETQILEVNADTPAERTAPPTWRQRWWQERRWRTMRGWYEMVVRAWVWAKEKVRVWRAATQARMRVGLEQAGGVAAAG
ncbi:hypothetical protein Q8F55_008771 [Vanrija albida]|uniref:RING-CH-type domain-containing protein n=1 Tax=Vanrija albida TaxID=181172 RepID=A0ABR3PRS4_9TREE